MVRFIKGLFFAVFFFAIFNFLYWNLDPGTLGHAVQFKFNLPPFLYLSSAPLPVGFIAILAFFLGTVVAAFLGLFQIFFRRFELHTSRKRIRHLEKTVAVLEDKLARATGLCASENEPSPPSS